MDRGCFLACPLFSLFGGLSGHPLGHQFHSLPLGSLADGYTIGGKIQVQENHCRKSDNFSVIIEFRKSIFFSCHKEAKMTDRVRNAFLFVLSLIVLSLGGSNSRSSSDKAQKQAENEKKRKETAERKAEQKRAAEEAKKK